MPIELFRAKAGVWRDFAGPDEHKGDALNLVAWALFRGDVGKAVSWSRHWLGYRQRRHGRPRTAPEPCGTTPRAGAAGRQSAPLLGGAAVSRGTTVARRHAGGGLSRESDDRPSAAWVRAESAALSPVALERREPAALAGTGRGDLKCRGPHGRHSSNMGKARRQRQGAAP